MSGTKKVPNFVRTCGHTKPHLGFRSCIAAAEPTRLGVGIGKVYLRRNRDSVGMRHPWRGAPSQARPGACEAGFEERAGAFLGGSLDRQRVDHVYPAVDEDPRCRVDSGAVGDPFHSGRGEFDPRTPGCAAEA